MQSPFQDSDGKNCNVQLSERLTSVGIMGARLRAPLTPSKLHRTMVLRTLKEGPQMWLQFAERLSLSDSLSVILRAWLFIHLHRTGHTTTGQFSPNSQRYSFFILNNTFPRVFKQQATTVKNSLR